MNNRLQVASLTCFGDIPTIYQALHGNHCLHERRNYNCIDVILKIKTKYLSFPTPHCYKNKLKMRAIRVKCFSHLGPLVQFVSNRTAALTKFLSVSQTSNAWGLLMAFHPFSCKHTVCIHTALYKTLGEGRATLAFVIKTWQLLNFKLSRSTWSSLTAFRIGNRR